MPPRILKVKGAAYRPVVMKVVGRDEHGRPRQLETLYDEESTDIEGGEHFLIVFVLEACIAKRAN